MNKQHYTIGMAGHIDHGKTELVKALTNVDTDRLKEEKERRISIELGYAPLFQDEHMSVSIIDVPGHEKFIKQMIAGVSAIDLTVLVIAADEGIMPQTLEHIDILTHLNITNHLIVLTKTDLVDRELLDLVKEDINQTVKHTVFYQTPVLEVDSISGKGIDFLKQQMIRQLELVEHNHSNYHLFVPFDQSFHKHGIGTIARGTVMEGQVSVNDDVYLMPQSIKTQIKSLQHFNSSVDEVFAGQRAAFALKNVSVGDLKRGTVLTKNRHAKATNRIDIELNISSLLKSEIKQRAPIKFHTGTSEVFGKIVFFDRNSLTSDSKTVYAQILLDNDVFVLKDQRFILRRATPIEMIGGGRIIEPHAIKHRHGVETVEQLRHKASFSAEEFLTDKVAQHPGITIRKLEEQLNSRIQTLNDDIVDLKGHLFLKRFVKDLKEDLIKIVNSFHEEHPLLKGIDKSALLSSIDLPNPENKILIDELIEQGVFLQEDTYILLPEFKITITESNQQLINNILKGLSEDELKVKNFKDYLDTHVDQKKLQEDIKLYFIQQRLVIPLTEQMVIETNVFYQATNQLRDQTSEIFDLKEAKDLLGVSRKYLIPFLEMLDQMHMTKREEQRRVWIK
ncbi:selenocysteine-specific translation elongation factor [Aquisalibacillus elongatus]|uniref:Selenocysteine-specific elongation factor n=1 Tax=Aquisalibacillus elongatus TaxID=485577 RepID=A0A3N5BDW4_9BACI|nr:selenocysteine-specific translation elongation factor [Aquisalibacillus elongatus]RPF55894.1 selenocysteine-specific elongation factor [Aquisalibacillus elongatus]